MPKLIFLFLLLIATSAVAQGNWEMYMVKLDNKPASVLVDLDCIHYAPDIRYPYLVITGPRANKCNLQGIPDTDEISQLEEILTTTGSFITGLTAKTLTGTVTHNCDRLNYYYVKDTQGVRTAIHRLYSRNFKEYSFVVNIKKDPEWKTYRNFLYPTTENANWIENNNIITNLLQHGDSLKTPRKIQFALLFKTDSARNEFKKYTAENGYELERLITSKISTSVPYGMIITKNMPAEMDIITKITDTLRNRAAMLNGKLDSWNSEVVK